MKRLTSSSKGRDVTAGFIHHEDSRLIQQLYPELRRFAAVTAPWDMDPEDVLHGALTRVLSKTRLHQLDDPVAYVRRSIINEAKSQIRRNQTARRAARRLRPAEPSTDPYPSDIADLQQLSPTERAVLFLHDIEGRPFDEIAQALEVTAVSARATASRARRRLKTLILEETS